MKYHAGMLNRYATVEDVHYVQDAFGGVNRDATVNEVLRCWVGIQNAKPGREMQDGLRQESEVSHKIIARWTDKIKSDMRLNIRGRLFNIVAVRNIQERDRWIEMDCKEVEGVTA